MITCFTHLYINFIIIFSYFYLNKKLNNFLHLYKALLKEPLENLERKNNHILTLEKPLEDLERKNNQILTPKK